MIKNLITAASLALLPVVSQAAVIPAVSPTVNALSADDYFVTLGASDYTGTFSLIFEADDAPRDVTATLAIAGPFLSTASAFFGGTAFSPLTGDTLTASLLAGEQVTFLMDWGTETKEVQSFQLDVTSVADAPVIPLPAALPLLLGALGAFGAVGAFQRRRHA